jgi:hypothetical protein
MSLFKQFRFFLWYFGFFNVPLIGYVRPKLLLLNDKSIVVRIPLKRRTKNHLGSMYFGTLAVGADIAGGLHGFYHAKKRNLKPVLAFKSFDAKFLKRPESDVCFVCHEGDVIQEMVVNASKTKERINKPIHIDAYTNYSTNPEKVATFILELSIKVP